jgi:hypothetical protein
MAFRRPGERRSSPGVLVEIGGDRRRQLTDLDVAQRGQVPQWSGLNFSCHRAIIDYPVEIDQTVATQRSQ